MNLQVAAFISTHSFTNYSAFLSTPATFLSVCSAFLSTFSRPVSLQVRLRFRSLFLLAPLRSCLCSFSFSSPVRSSPCSFKSLFVLFLESCLFVSFFVFVPVHSGPCSGADCCNRASCSLASVAKEVWISSLVQNKGVYCRCLEPYILAQHNSFLTQPILVKCKD